MNQHNLNVIPDQQSEKRKLEAFFLPDLCNVRAVLALVLVSEFLVVALLLAQYGLFGIHWEDFGLVSFFVLWVSLISATLLCQSRVFLSRLSVPFAMLWAMALLLFASLSISLIAESIMPFTGDDADINWEWIAGNMLVSAIFGGMALRYFYVQSQWRLKSQAELGSRLQALQARIRPHFFFNTLNTVASLIVIDPEKAEEMLLDLAALFRVVLKEGQEFTDIENELDLAEKYIEIEEARLGDRLTVEWKIDDVLPPVQVPQLLLQPLLENAVYHGIQPLPKGGKITIQVTVAGKAKRQYCDIMIRNDMPDSESQPSQGQEMLKGNGMALTNTEQRLAGFYEDQAKVEYQQEHQAFIVHIKLPVAANHK